MKNSIKIAFIFFILIGSNSCEKGFEELNENPFEPTQTDIGPLFNGVIESLQLGWSEQFYLHNEFLYEITELAALTAKTFQNFNIGGEDAWSNFYKTLPNIREIEQRLDAHTGEQEATNNVRAMLKTVLAYKTFHLTDLFGDIPFSEAGRAFENLDFLEPKFDSQEEIYKSLLTELAWVQENVNTLPNATTDSGEAYLTLNSFDNLFNNDMRMWQKFANSMRLRYALRMVEKDPSFANPILKDILENDLPILKDGENVVLSPQALSWRKQSTHWSFREHRKLRMGTNIWHRFSDNDELDGSGIFDPRARIFFEENNQNEWAAYPQIPTSDTPPSGGSPYQNLRDGNYFFKGQSNIYAPFNYYLTRDEESIPEILMTSAEVSFIIAEIYLRGLGVAANENEANAIYTTGVVSSLTFWQNIMVNTPIWEHKPTILSGTDLFAVTNHPSILIFGNPNKLELIYKQRWIDSFRQPWEAYALLRRTKATPRENPIPEHYRFNYPPSEVENNPDSWAAQVAKMGEDAATVKVWWME